MKTIFNFQRLTERSFLGTSTHCTRANSFGISYNKEKGGNIGKSIVYKKCDKMFFLPVLIVVPPTLQATLSFHNSKLISGSALQGTRGFKKGSGISNMALWIFVTWSQLLHMTLDKVTLRISASCASVNRISGFPFSYQKRSHFRKFRNWIPIIQANVGPTSPPCKGVSASPPKILLYQFESQFWL